MSPPFWGIAEMTLLPVNLLIALAWATVSGEFSPPNLLLGFVAGFIALGAFNESYAGARYHRRTFATFGLALYFIWDLLRSSWQVVLATLFQHHRGKSRFVEMPLDVESDFGIMLTANLISLTPGTLSVDVAEDKSSLLIHAMFAEDAADVVHGLKQGLERRGIEGLR
jgi:multicomponent Na+:H+ antiporter subunit E